jgi:poly(A) polymerase Pap1
MKVIEKAIKIKAESLGDGLFTTGSYQMGFKKGHSTMDNLALVMKKVMRSLRKRSERKVYCAIDLRKAYDRVDRTILFKVLQ